MELLEVVGIPGDDFCEGECEDFFAIQHFLPPPPAPPFLDLGEAISGANASQNSVDWQCDICAWASKNETTGAFHTDDGFLEPNFLLLIASLSVTSTLVGLCVVVCVFQWRRFRHGRSCADSIKYAIARCCCCPSECVGEKSSSPGLPGTPDMKKTVVSSAGWTLKLWRRSDTRPLENSSATTSPDCDIHNSKSICQSESMPLYEDLNPYCEIQQPTPGPTFTTEKARVSRVVSEYHVSDICGISEYQSATMALPHRNNAYHYDVAMLGQQRRPKNRAAGGGGRPPLRRPGHCETMDVATICDRTQQRQYDPHYCHLPATLNRRHKPVSANCASRQHLSRDALLLPEENPSKPLPPLPSRQIHGPMARYQNRSTTNRAWSTERDAGDECGKQTLCASQDDICGQQQRRESDSCYQGQRNCDRCHQSQRHVAGVGSSISSSCYPSSGHSVPQLNLISQQQQRSNVNWIAMQERGQFPDCI